MKLELSQKLQQQQILAPQMILSMDILLLNAADLQQRIEKEFIENPALELSEQTGQPTIPEAAAADAGVQPKTESFEKISTFESKDDSFARDTRSRQVRREASDAKHETLQNAEGKPPGLKDFLNDQLRVLPLPRDARDASEFIINNLDHRGYLESGPDDLFEGLGADASRTEFDEALEIVQNLDPAGVGAENLQDCLLLQLARDPQTYPLETRIILNHLQDVGQNRLPKIAKELNATLDDLKTALEIIQSLDPLPGARYETAQTIYVRPDVVVEEVDNELIVRVEDGDLPPLKINDECRELLKKSRSDRETSSFLKKKLDSAQWLIQAVEQRQRTLHDIAVAMVDHQQDFMLKGPECLKALKMQTLADRVGVHISTVSRAIKGKYVQTPYGLYDLRYFFTGGVGNADGEVESRRNVYRKISDIITKEDKRKPYSDTTIAKILQEDGLSIARRTVTKYREAEGIPSSRLRKSY